MFSFRITTIEIIAALQIVGSMNNLAKAQEPEFTYLEPSEVNELSEDIVAALNTENCKIPKWIFEFGGVTKGEFATAGQEDAAVICKYENKTEIRIFWGGSSSCNSRIKSHGQFISTVGEKYILDHYHVYGGPNPPKIDHQAINDHFVEKSSIVKFCDKGKWVELTGAD